MGKLSLSLIAACTAAGDERVPPDGGPAIGCRPGGPCVGVPAEVPPANVILRSRIAGGIAGYANRTDLTEDGILSGFHFDSLVASARLGPEEMKEVEGLRTRASRVAVEHSAGPGVADGMYSMLIFQGRGTQYLETEVNELRERLDGRIEDAKRVWHCPAIVMAMASAPAPRSTCVAQGLIVTATLKEPDLATILEGTRVDVGCVRWLPEKEWSSERAFCLGVMEEGAISTVENAWPLQIEEKTIQEMVLDQRELGD
jgi:hypothetical protein